MLVASCVAQGLERVGVVAATASVAFSGVRAQGSVVVTAVLAVVFFVRGVLSSSLRFRVRGRALEVLVSAMLSDSGDVTRAPDDQIEPALFDGLYGTEEALGLWLPQVVGDGVACVVAGVLIACFEPLKLVVAGGLAILVGAGAAVAVRRVATASTERQWRALLPALDDLTTAIRGRLEIVSNGGAPRFERGVAEKLAVWRSVSASSRVVMFLAGRAPVVGAAVVVGLFFLHEGGSTSNGLAHAAVLASVTPAFAGVAKGALDLARSLVRASGLVEAVDRAASAADGRETDGTESPHFPATVSWEAVSFSYASGSGADAGAALAGVNVCWAPGTLLGLAGQNGSGKSTFVRLLLGLHTPSKGIVRVGDRPLQELRRASLRENVAYLAQRPFLPDRVTVADAIHLLAPSSVATHAAMEAILRRLALWPVLERRNPSAPLDVKVGTLSAGQKQRVAIARVLLRRTPLLLLDEPDANLDAEGIALVAEIVREEAKSRMVLVVAHSQALLATVDRVIHFEDGRVVMAASRG